MDRIEFEPASGRPADAPAPPVPHFWMMTIQVQTPVGMSQLTRTGLCHVTPTTTYTQAFTDVLNLMRGAAGIGETDSAVVLAWTLAPEALGGAR